MNGKLEAVCNDEVFGVLYAAGGKFNFRRTRDCHTKFWPVSTYLQNRSRLNKPVVIIIESPHIEEFKVYNVVNAENMTPVNARPANGATGRNVCELLPSLLENHNVSISDGKYPLILINAIQKQCSEGRDTCISRTRNFLKLWPSHVSDLCERLRALDPLMVINACTKGDFYLRSQDGALTRNKSFNSGFDQNFENLLNNELNCVTDDEGSDFIFMNSFDLSGLIMFQVDCLYGEKNIPIYKTSHPSSWGFRQPRLFPYKRAIVRRFSLKS